MGADATFRSMSNDGLSFANKNLSKAINACNEAYNTVAKKNFSSSFDNARSSYNQSALKNIENIGSLINDQIAAGNKEEVQRLEQRRAQMQSQFEAQQSIYGKMKNADDNIRNLEAQRTAAQEQLKKFEDNASKECRLAIKTVEREIERANANAESRIRSIESQRSSQIELGQISMGDSAYMGFEAQIQAEKRALEERVRNISQDTDYARREALRNAIKECDAHYQQAERERDGLITRYTFSDSAEADKFCSAMERQGVLIARNSDRDDGHDRTVVQMSSEMAQKYATEYAKQNDTTLQTWHEREVKSKDVDIYSGQERYGQYDENTRVNSGMARQIMQSSLPEAVKLADTVGRFQFAVQDFVKEDNDSYHGAHLLIRGLTATDTAKDNAFKEIQAMAAAASYMSKSDDARTALEAARAEVNKAQSHFDSLASEYSRQAGIMDESVAKVTNFANITVAQEQAQKLALEKSNAFSEMVGGNVDRDKIKEFKSIMEERNDLNKSLDTLNKKYNDLSASLAEKGGSDKGLEAQLAKISGHRDTAQANLDKLNSRFDALELGKAEKMTALGAIAVERDGVNKSLEALNKKYNDLSASLAAKGGADKELEAQLTKIGERRDFAKANLDDLNSRFDKMSSGLGKSEKELAKLSTAAVDRANAESKLSDIRKQYANLEKLEKGDASLGEDMTKKLKEMQKARDELDSKTKIALAQEQALRDAEKKEGNYLSARSEEKERLAERKGDKKFSVKEYEKQQKADALAMKKLAEKYNLNDKDFAKMDFNTMLLLRGKMEKDMMMNGINIRTKWGNVDKMELKRLLNMKDADLKKLGFDRKQLSLYQKMIATDKGKGLKAAGSLWAMALKYGSKMDGSDMRWAQDINRAVSTGKKTVKVIKQTRTLYLRAEDTLRLKAGLKPRVNKESKLKKKVNNTMNKLADKARPKLSEKQIQKRLARSDRKEKIRRKIYEKTGAPLKAAKKKLLDSKAGQFVSKISKAFDAMKKKIMEFLLKLIPKAGAVAGVVLLIIAACAAIVVIIATIGSFLGKPNIKLTLAYCLYDDLKTSEDAWIDFNSGVINSASALETAGESVTAWADSVCEALEIKKVSEVLAGDSEDMNFNLYYTLYADSRISRARHDVKYTNLLGIEQYPATPFYYGMDTYYEQLRRPWVGRGHIITVDNRSGDEPQGIKWSDWVYGSADSTSDIWGLVKEFFTAEDDKPLFYAYVNPFTTAKTTGATDVKVYLPMIPDWDWASNTAEENFAMFQREGVFNDLPLKAINTWNGGNQLIVTANVHMPNYEQREAMRTGTDYLSLATISAMDSRASDYISYGGHTSNIRDIMCMTDVVFDMSLDDERKNRTQLSDGIIGTQWNAFWSDLGQKFSFGWASISSLFNGGESLKQWYADNPDNPTSYEDLALYTNTLFQLSHQTSLELELVFLPTHTPAEGEYNMNDGFIKMCPKADEGGCVNYDKFRMFLQVGGTYVGVYTLVDQTGDGYTLDDFQTQECVWYPVAKVTATSVHSPSFDTSEIIAIEENMTRQDLHGMEFTYSAPVVNMADDNPVCFLANTPQALKTAGVWGDNSGNSGAGNSANGHYTGTVGSINSGKWVTGSGNSYGDMSARIRSNSGAEQLRNLAENHLGESIPEEKRCWKKIEDGVRISEDSSVKYTSGALASGALGSDLSAYKLSHEGIAIEWNGYGTTLDEMYVAYYQCYSEYIGSHEEITGSCSNSNCSCHTGTSCGKCSSCCSRTTYYDYKLYTKRTTYEHDCKGHEGNYCGGHIQCKTIGIVYSFDKNQTAEFEDASMRKVELVAKVHDVDYTTAWTATHNTDRSRNLNLNVKNVYGSPMWVKWDISSVGVTGFVGGAVPAGLGATSPSPFVLNEVDDSDRYGIYDWNDLFDVDNYLKWNEGLFPPKNYKQYDGWNLDRMTLACVKYARDWTDIYQFDIGLNMGSNVLSEEDINNIMEGLVKHYGELSEKRENAVRMALHAVGNGTYNQAHHAHAYIQQPAHLYTNPDGTKDYLYCTTSDCSGFAGYILGGGYQIWTIDPDSGDVTVEWSNDDSFASSWSYNATVTGSTERGGAGVCESMVSAGTNISGRTPDAAGMKPGDIICNKAHAMVFIGVVETDDPEGIKIAGGGIDGLVKPSEEHYGDDDDYWNIIPSGTPLLVDCTSVQADTARKGMLSEAAAALTDTYYGNIYLRYHGCRWGDWLGEGGQMPATMSDTWSGGGSPLTFLSFGD